LVKIKDLVAEISQGLAKIINQDFKIKETLLEVNHNLEEVFNLAQEEYMEHNKIINSEVRKILIRQIHIN
jgi:hypothetical protein